MTWLKQNWFKIGILLVALLVIATAFFSYQSYLDRKSAAETMEQLRKEAESKKEYIADRKTDCLAIYKTESDQWNNVRGWRYDEESDSCFIRYREPNPKSDAKCDELYPTTGDGRLFSWWRENLLCKEGEFENSF